MTASTPSLRTLPRPIVAVILGVALAATLAACGSGANGEERPAMVVVDPSVDLPANPSLAAIRFRLENRTATPDVLVGVSSPDGNASIHRSDVDDAGRSTMAPADRLPLPARSTVEFAPGGLHVMLDDITRDLEVGETVRLELEFEVHQGLTVDVPVVEPLSSSTDGHDDEHRSMAAAPAPRTAGALR